MNLKLPLIRSQRAMEFGIIKNRIRKHLVSDLFIVRNYNQSSFWSHLNNPFRWAGPLEC